MVVAGLTVSAAAPSSTSAAWTDRVLVSAAANAGQWADALVPPPAIVVGTVDTVVDDVDWQITGTPTDPFCVEVAVTGDSATPEPWALLVHLDRPPFYGATVNEMYYRGANQVLITQDPNDSTLARITGVSTPGNPWNANYNNALLTSSQELVITVCDSSPRVPTPAPAAWYTTSVTQGTWTPTQACVTITATALVGEDNPFYFGWEADLDLTGAKNEITSNHKTVNYVSWSPDPSNGYQFVTTPTTYIPVANSYHITSGRVTAIKYHTPASITACVNGY